MRTKLDHIAFRVTNVEESVGFFQAVLGSEYKGVHVFNPEAPPTKTVAVVETHGGLLLDLFGAEATAADPGDGANLGLIHYCFSVDDVDAAIARAKAAGARTYRDTKTLSDSGKPDRSIRVGYVIDPNGAICEFVSHDWLDTVRSWTPSDSTAGDQS